MNKNLAGRDLSKPWGFGCGIFGLIAAGIFSYSIGWPLLAPYVIGRNCELPYTVSMKKDLDLLVGRFATDLVENRKTEIRNHLTDIWNHQTENYLRKLTPQDQLYVVHHGIRKIGGVFHSQSIRTFSFEYKVSPIYFKTLVTYFFPSTYMYRWIVLKVSLYNDYTREHEKNSTNKYPVISERHPGRGGTGRGRANPFLPNFRGYRSYDFACPTHLPISEN